MPVYLLNESYEFPPAEGAEEGIVAVGGDLSPQRLLNAYKSGIFPWYSNGEPIIWWSPDPRFVLFPDELHISKSMQRILKAGVFEATMDTDFQHIIRQCAVVSRKGENGTWITEDMIAAYRTLHELGYAHSLEVRSNGEIVGGIYGISLGKCFFAESMFHTTSNASKFALIKLVDYLKRNEFLFLDAQIHTAHVESMGGKDISRNEFLRLLHKGLSGESMVGKWTF